MLSLPICLPTPARLTIAPLSSRVQLGGNAPFTTFINEYGPTGGYIKGMNITEKYNTWAAAQYREKVSSTAAPSLF